MEGINNLFIKKTPIIEVAVQAEEPVIFSREKEHSDHALIKNKINICRGAVTEKLGSPNVYETTKYLYASLYHPEQGDQMVSPSNRFPDRITTFRKALSILPSEIPTEKEFI